jgi:hypothetical protein
MAARCCAVSLDALYIGSVWWLTLPLILWELSVAEQRYRAVLEVRAGFR